MATLGIGLHSAKFARLCLSGWWENALYFTLKLVFRQKSAFDGQIPFFTSDELTHYADALLEVYGEREQPPRYGNPGCFPKPNRVLPPDLNYAVVVKKPLITRDANQRTQRFVPKMETGNSCTGSGFDRSHLDYGGSRASSPSNSHGVIYVHASLSFSTDPVNVVGLTTCYGSLIPSNSSALDREGLPILVLRNTSKITVKTNNRIWGGKLASVINVGLFASEWIPIARKRFPDSRYMAV